MAALSQDELLHLEDIRPKFKSVSDKFYTVQGMQPNERFPDSFNRLGSLKPLTFCKNKGLPYDEERDNLKSYTEGSLRLMKDVCGGYEGLQRLSRMLYMADVPLSITYGLRQKSKNIGEDETLRLDRMAARLIFEHDNFQEYLELWNEFTDGETTTAQIARSLREGFLCLKIAEYEDRFGAEAYDSLWDSLSYDRGTTEEIMSQIKHRYDVHRGLYDNAPAPKLVRN